MRRLTATVASHSLKEVKELKELMPSWSEDRSEQRMTERKRTSPPHRRQRVAAHEQPPATTVARASLPSGPTTAALPTPFGKATA